MASAAKKLPYFWRGSAPLPSVANWPQGCCQHLRQLFQWKPNWESLLANLLGGLVGEGDPNPLANNLGQVVGGGQPLPEEVENLLGSKGAILFALLEVHIGENPRFLLGGSLGLRCCVVVCAQLLRTAREP